MASNNLLPIQAYDAKVRLHYQTPYAVMAMHESTPSFRKKLRVFGFLQEPILGSASKFEQTMRYSFIKKEAFMRVKESMVHVLSLALALAGLVAPATAQSCQWSALGSGMNNPVLALVVYSNESGPALYTG